MRADHSDALSVAATDATRTALRVACIHMAAAAEAIAEQVRQAEQMQTACGRLATGEWKARQWWTAPIARAA
jgi:hypothetical protein